MWTALRGLGVDGCDEEVDERGRADVSVRPMATGHRCDAEAQRAAQGSSLGAREDQSASPVVE